MATISTDSVKHSAALWFVPCQLIISMGNFFSLVTQGQITIDGNFSGGLSLTSQEYPDGYNLGSQGGYFASFPPEMKLFMDSVTEGNSNKMASLSREAMSEVLVAKAIYKSVGSKKWEVPSVQNLISTEK